MKSKRNYKKNQRAFRLVLLVALMSGILGVTTLSSRAEALASTSFFAAADQNGPAKPSTAPTGPVDIKLDKVQPTTHDTCGGGKNATKLSVDIGCKGQGNPVTDMVFAIIRFLSTGAGILIVASLVYAGVQYILARDDPSKVGEAKQRISNTFGALLIYIFAYAILNYVIPAGFFK